MNIRTVFMSAFDKQCPHCCNSINVCELPKIPRDVTLRWYQFTPAPHSACPLCGGYVTSTIGNSPWLIAAFLPLISLMFLGFKWPAITRFTKEPLGGLFMLALVCPIIWLAMKKSKLICEK
jgi:hypothetical protein